LIIKYTNLSYTEDKIKNSFKIGGANYIENITEINDGKDYDKTDRNIYDLYIPYNNIKKNGTNLIILFIHSGGWKLGSKEEMTYFCLITSNYGYITANIGYTLLSQEYKKYNVNIFRILDEITAAIENIKIILGKEGLNTDKLEIAISGASAGGHLSLLYTI
jgi:acetyl esterase/lipase